MAAKKKSIPAKLLKLDPETQAHSFYYYTDVIHDRCIDIDSREIWLHGTESFYDGYEAPAEPGVDYMMSTKLIKNLHILKHADPTAPITIHLHTCGGDVVEGLAIYDAIKLMPMKVKMISYTHARSMSSYILQAADERVLLPSSYFMFHDGEMWNGGTVKQNKAYMELADKHEDILVKIYVDALKAKGKYKEKSAEFIKKLMRDMMDKKEDVYLMATEAVEWGFADSIADKL
jgi:ATP-dependent Clp protease protease subunit